MKYQRHEMRISLLCTPARWEWYLFESGDDEVLASGMNWSYETAANEALEAFDSFLDGER